MIFLQRPMSLTLLAVIVPIMVVPRLLKNALEFIATYALRVRSERLFDSFSLKAPTTCSRCCA